MISRAARVRSIGAATTAVRRRRPPHARAGDIIITTIATGTPMTGAADGTIIVGTIITTTIIATTIGAAAGATTSVTPRP